MWQALLLSQTQLTQGLGHLTTSHSLTTKVADILTNFLPPKDSPPSNPTPAKPNLDMSVSASSPVKRGPPSPAASFMLVLKLWGVVKNVLASSCLSKMAERVLDAVLAKEYPLSEDKKFQNGWTALCSDLVTSCFAHAVALILHPPSPSNGSDESKLATIRTDTRSEIWRMVAGSWQSSATGISWETGLQFLVTARE